MTWKNALSAFATLLVAALALGGAYVFGQHSPAPSGPAESPRMVGAPPPAGVAPGVHPPAPSDGSRFEAAPPPPTGTAGPGEVLPGQRRPPTMTTTTPGASIRTPTPTSRKRKARVPSVTPMPRLTPYPAA